MFELLPSSNYLKQLTLPFSFVQIFHNKLVVPNMQTWGNSVLSFFFFFFFEKLVLYFCFIVYLLTTFNLWQNLNSDDQCFLKVNCEDLQPVFCLQF